MYAKRIIPCLDVKNGRVVKGEKEYYTNVYVNREWIDV